MDKGPSCPAVHWFGAAAGTPPGNNTEFAMAVIRSGRGRVRV